MSRASRTRAPLAAVALSFLSGSVPYSQLAARRFAGADLRRVGSGKVSGTALYQVAGFGPLAVAGLFEVAKGATGPLLGRRALGAAVRRRATGGRGPVSYLGAFTTAAAIAGHDWSPWMGGAGGRGLSPALGATLLLAPEGTLVLAAGMAAGRLLRQSGLSTLLAALSLVAVLGMRRGASGTALGLAICVPMLVKRSLGDSPPQPVSESTDDARRAPLAARLYSRLLFDREPGAAHGAPQGCCRSAPQ
ncbi:MAG: glycerol-3-phosphate acyltransferase [Acidimicrobiales bacterium]